jgi:hypothetical protein
MMCQLAALCKGTNVWLSSTAGGNVITPIPEHAMLLKPRFVVVNKQMPF